MEVRGRPATSASCHPSSSSDTTCDVIRQIPRSCACGGHPHATGSAARIPARTPRRRIVTTSSLRYGVLAAAAPRLLSGRSDLTSRQFGDASGRLDRRHPGSRHRRSAHSRLRSSGRCGVSRVSRAARPPPPSQRATYTCVWRCLPGPVYGGPLRGLPFNIEGLLRRLQDKFGDRLNPLELDLPYRFELHHLVDANEDSPGNAATVPSHRPPRGSPTSGSTAGTCVTGCRTPPVSPQPGSPRRRLTTTCSAPSRPTTATSPRAPSSARSGRRRPRSTPPAGSARTAASAR